MYENPNNAYVRMGVGGIADFITSIIKENKRERRVKEYDTALDSVRDFDQASRDLHSYKVQMANLLNAPIGQAPADSEKTIYAPGIQAPNPIVETPAPTEETPPEQTIDPTAPISVAPGNVTTEDFHKRLSVPIGSTTNRNAVMPVAPMTDQELAIKLQEVQKRIGSLNTQGQQGRLLSQNLQGALQNSIEQNKSQYFITAKDGYIVQASLTNPGESVVLGKLPDDKKNYSVIDRSEPYELDGQAGNWVQDIILVNSGNPNDRFRYVVKGQDPLLKENFKLDNYGFGNRSNRGGLSGKSPQDLLAENFESLVYLHEQNRASANEIDQQRSSFEKEDFEKKRSEINAKLNTTNSQIASLSGFNGEFLTKILEQGNFNAQEVLKYGEEYKNFLSQPYNDYGKSIGQWLEEAKQGVANGSWTQQNFSVFLNQVNTLLRGAGLSKEALEFVYVYINDIANGGYLQEVQRNKFNADQNKKIKP